MQKFVLTTIALHNYLRLADHAVYTPVGFVNSQASSGEIRPGEWRRIVDDVGVPYQMSVGHGMQMLLLLCVK